MIYFAFFSSIIYQIQEHNLQKPEHKLVFIKELKNRINFKILSIISSGLVMGLQAIALNLVTHARQFCCGEKWPRRCVWGSKAAPLDLRNPAVSEKTVGFN